MAFLLGVCLAWLALHTVAAVLKHICEVNSLGISFFSVSLQTSQCNRLFYKFGKQHNAFLRQWYRFGVAVAAMLALSVIFMLGQDVWLALGWIKEAMSMGPEIAPSVRVGPLGPASGAQGFAMGLAVPGLTVPWGHAGYLWLATAASIAVHEAGHALAAASEGVGVQHVGAFTLLLLPGAYVALDSGALAALGPWRTLRVICAGVWHNAVLCALCWLCALLLPLLLVPLYSTGTGVTVRGLPEGSPMFGQLEAGDRIWLLNDCPITSSRTWLGCLALSRQQEANSPDDARSGHAASKGWCVAQSLVQTSSSCSAAGSADQCSSNSLCFVKGQEKESLDKWASTFVTRKVQATRGGAGSCLHARSATAGQPCDRHSQAGLSCPTGSLCMSPMVSPGEHMFKVCFQPGPGQTAEPRWLPGQASATGRRHLQAESTVNSSIAVHYTHQAVYSRQRSRASEMPARLAGIHDSTDTSSVELFDQSDQQAGLPHSNNTSSKSEPSVLHNSHLNTTALHRQLADGAERQHTDAQSGSDRIGRVALASEHRKIIQRHVPDPAEAMLTCPHYLVYVGTAGQLLQAVQLSDYVPKFSLVPLQWPHMVEQLLVYTFAVSAALALINMAPIWYLDGEAALIEAVKLRGHSEMFYSPAAKPPRVWGRLLRMVLGVGTGVFVCVLMLHMIRILGYDAKVGHMLHTLGKLLSFVLT